MQDLSAKLLTYKIDTKFALNHFEVVNTNVTIQDCIL